MSYEQRIAHLPVHLRLFVLHDDDTKADILEQDLDADEITDIAYLNYSLLS